MKPGGAAQSDAMRALVRRWVLTLLTFLAFLAAMNTLLAANWSAPIRWSWTMAAAAFCAYVLATLWKALPFNYRIDDGYFFPFFGAGNLLSLMRGGFLAALAGFLVSPQPTAWLAWMPGILYILNGIADLLDGYLARRAHQVTAMGERLDMSLDGLGVLFASLLLYRYGTLPMWILLVGTARFIFLLVTNIRHKLAKPVYELPPSPLRRALAGAQMGYLGAALLPVFSPPATIWAGAFFSFPFLVHFGRDLLWSCGVLSETSRLRTFSPALTRHLRVAKGWLFEWLPVGLRLLIAAAVIAQSLAWLGSPPSFLAAWTPLGSAQAQFYLMLVFYALGWVSVVFGVVSRAGAALVLIGVGLQQGILPLGWAAIGVLVAACGVFFLGSGKASLWKPEERLIRRRWGEK